MLCLLSIPVKKNDRHVLWLTIVRFSSPIVAQRALQNPALFTSDHYRQAAIAVVAGIAIRLLIAVPVRAVEFMTVVMSPPPTLYGFILITTYSRLSASKS